MLENRLMILGSMDEFQDLVEKAQARGIYTIVCDGYANGPAKKKADKVYDIDIREVDEIAKVCKKEKVNGIISSFSDILFEYLVKIAEKAGLKTYCTPENSVFLRSKTEMNKMFKELKIPVPKNITLKRNFSEDELSGFHFPLVIKPVNGYGSRGIFVVNNEEEIRQRFDDVIQYSSFDDEIVVETYNDGYEFNMMNWIMDGEVYTISCADREKSSEIAGDIPFVSRVTYPSRIIDEVLEEAKSIVKKVAAYTGIKTGPLSMQFFYTPDGGIEVCECAGRFFGYEHELVWYGSGLSIEELLLDYIYDEASMRKRIEMHDPHFKNYTAGLYFHGYEGEIADLTQAWKFIEKVNPLESKIFYKEGETISHGLGAKPYLIRLYIQNDTIEELDKETQELFNEVRVYDKNGRNLVYHGRITHYDK